MTDSPLRPATSVPDESTVRLLPSLSSRLSQHASAAELVRSMTRANRVDATHLRTVLAHVEDRRGVLEALLDRSVLCTLAKLDIIRETSTVEAFACQLFGVSFHGLTFSLRPSPNRPFPSTSLLTKVAVGKMPKRVKKSVPAVIEDPTLAMYDIARLPTTVFDGATTEQYLVQLPHTGASDQPQSDPRSFRDLALRVTGLARSIQRPISFIHAPTAAPTYLNAPRSVTGPCLRVGLAFPELDGGRRLSFGTELVALCSDEGYGLWQRPTSSGNQIHDYWQPVVPPEAGTSGRAAACEVPLPGPGLAVTCVGPARAGSTQAILQILAHARAPLLALSATTLDDIAVIHLVTRAPLGHKIDALDLPTDLRADAVLNTALTQKPPHLTDRLRDYRAVVSSHTERPSDPDLVALWLAWTAPAAPDTLRLTVETLRTALDSVSARYMADTADKTRDGHLNIEYLVCREVSGDRLRGRMRVAIDLAALGVTAAPAEPVETPTGSDDSPVSRLSHFCSDLERQWRTSLSFALRTSQVELDVVWRESWLGRWTRLEPDSQDDPV